MATNHHSLWTRDELIIAFNLYCKIPFGQIDQSNSAVIALADVLGRTPASLSWKLANFARLDPALQARGIKGASHGSKGEVAVWEEFNNNWDSLAFESERLLANLTNQSVEEMNGLKEEDLPKEGLERERIVKSPSKPTVLSHNCLSVLCVSVLYNRTRRFQCCLAQATSRHGRKIRTTE